MIFVQVNRPFGVGESKVQTVYHCDEFKGFQGNVRFLNEPKTIFITPRN